MCLKLQNPPQGMIKHRLLGPTHRVSVSEENPRLSTLIPDELGNVFITRTIYSLFKIASRFMDTDDKL